MFLAIDRVSRFTYVEFHENAGKMNRADFLRKVVKAFPYKIHTVLTDNGMAFADLPKNRNGASRQYLGAHIFDRVCTENGIEHRPTKPYHPWTNYGQAERMNRTIKEATIEVFHYPSLESLKAHVLAFVTAYNFAKHPGLYDGKRRSRLSASHGRKTLTPSSSILATSSRYQTPNAFRIVSGLNQGCPSRNQSSARGRRMTAAAQWSDHDPPLDVGLHGDVYSSTRSPMGYRLGVLRIEKNCAKVN
jgi:hypothetical protein